jgi:hypothetical protein
MKIIEVNGRLISLEGMRQIFITSDPQLGDEPFVMISFDSAPSIIVSGDAQTVYQEIKRQLMGDSDAS